MAMCSYCGREARPNDIFCKYCGQRLQGGDIKYTAMEFPAVSGGASSGPLQGDEPRVLATAAARGAGDAVSRLGYGGVGAASGAPSANGVSRAMLGRLIVRPLASEEGGQTHEVPLDGRDVAVGRSPACDIVLEGDQLVSRRHALLRYNGSQYTIVDLGSSNGTYINDQEIHQAAALNDGDLITIGEHELLYSARPAAGVSAGGASDALASPGYISAASLVDEGHDHLAVPGGADETARYPVAGNGAGPAAFAPAAMEPLREPAPSWQQPTPSAPAAPAQPIQQGYRPAFAPSAPAAPAQPQPAFDRPYPGAQSDTGVARRAQQEPQPYQASAYQPTLAPARAGTTGPHNTSAQLEAVRARLAEANRQLQEMEDDAQLSERRRDALVEVRDRLGGILAAQRRSQGTQAAPAGAPAANQDLNNLVGIVRQAADNPQHIHYMMQLSLHAGEIAQALEAQQAQQTRPAPAGAPAALLAQLEELRAHLDELVG